MKIKGTKIYLNDLRIYAMHGVGEQENIVGNSYIINIELDADYSRAALTDNLDYTVSYADVYELVREEMAVPSKLLEHVAYRIASHILERFELVSSVSVSLMKENPPMGADIASCGVHITLER